MRHGISGYVRIDSGRRPSDIRIANKTAYRPWQWTVNMWKNGSGYLIFVRPVINLRIWCRTWGKHVFISGGDKLAESFHVTPAGRGLLYIKSEMGNSCCKVDRPEYMIKLLRTQNDECVCQREKGQISVRGREYYARMSARVGESGLLLYAGQQLSDTIWEYFLGTGLLAAAVLLLQTVLKSYDLHSVLLFQNS